MVVCYNGPRKLTIRPSPVTAPLSDRGHPLVGLRHAAGQRPGSLGEPRVGELWQRGARSHALGKAKRGTCSLVPEMRLRCYSSSFVMEKTEPADDEIAQLCLHSVSGGARGELPLASQAWAPSVTCRIPFSAWPTTSGGCKE